MTREDLGKKFYKDGKTYEAIAYIDTPTIELRNIDNNDERISVVVDSDYSKEFKLIEDPPKENKKIKKLDTYVDIASFNNSVCYDEDNSLDAWIASLQKGLEEQTKFNRDVLYKINEIIDRLNGEDNESK